MLAIYEPIVRTSAISFEVDPPTVAQFAERVRQTLIADQWLVMEVDGEVAGYAYSSDFRNRPAYGATRETTVYVHPDHFRVGVARSLIVELLDRLADAGTAVAVAGIALPNPGSIALHESLGFCHVGTFHRIGRKFDRWHDVGFWELLLDDRSGDQIS